MKYYSTFVFLMLIASFSSCNSQQSTSAISAQNPPTTNTTNLENKIVYLFFTIERSENGNEIVKFTDKKITDGIIKNASINDKEYAAGNILVTFLAKDGKEISRRIIEDPLNPEMEIYAEEGLDREKIKLPKAEFSIRFNQTGKISQVILEKINSNSKTNLATIKL